MAKFPIMRPLLASAALSLAAGAVAQERPEPPYWASISAGKARMRTGPARAYPSSWIYQRADLPVRVVAVHKEWRRVRDPDGAEGWMLGGLISSTRTAIVRAAVPAAMRDRPGAGGRLLWRVAPGVVGRLSACGDGWCRLDVKGRKGFVRTGDLWGVGPGETLP